jgi:hypothetical protein
MAEPDAGLRKAWERVVADGDPLDALRAARDLKDELARWEAHLARKALAAGETWETIGAALGISRQAAWERLRKAIQAEIEADRARVKAERDRLAAKRRAKT